LTARRPAPGARPGMDVYVPLSYGNQFSPLASDGRRAEFLRVLARARQDIGADGIEGDVRRVGSLLQSAFPNINGRLTFGATPLRQVTVGDAETPLLVLLGAVGFVLLVACANVANLLLARASTRQGELAVRAALGAGRGRLFRQLLTESVVLGLCGGALGLLLAYAGTKALIAAQPADIPRLEEIGVDGTVMAFTLATALLTSLAFGALPALQATGASLMGVLREGGRSGTAGRSGHRARASLVVAEIALAVMLLMGAGLLIRSFVALTRVDLGFSTEQAMAFRLSFQGEAYQEGQQIRTRVNELEEALRALPGVRAAGAGSILPLAGRGSMWSFGVPDAAPPPADVNAEIAVVLITPDYFRAIGTPLVSGRGFDDRDHDDAPTVALINEAGVRRWFAGEDPVGRRVDANGEREIVGVVSDVLHGEPGEPPLAHLYVPYAQATSRTVRFVVRTAGDPLALVGAIRAEVRSLDPNLVIPEFAPLGELVAASVAGPRFYTSLLTLFAGIALALAATGVFGVMSYTVAQRTREISIRMALGARAGDVLRIVVGRALMLAALGVAVGAVAAIQLGTVLESQLFGVTLLDPITFGGVVLVLAVSAAAASYLPARRAARLDPGTTLRDG
ncbi:MAG: ADOP family duplicated permease, partial [Longimicrobiales bacterium]